MFQIDARFLVLVPIAIGMEQFSVATVLREQTPIPIAIGTPEGDFFKKCCQSVAGFLDFIIWNNFCPCKRFIQYAKNFCRHIYGGYATSNIRKIVEYLHDVIKL